MRLPTFALLLVTASCASPSARSDTPAVGPVSSSTFSPAKFGGRDPQVSCSGIGRLALNVERAGRKETLRFHDVSLTMQPPYEASLMLSLEAHTTDGAALEISGDLGRDELGLKLGGDVIAIRAVSSPRDERPSSHWFWFEGARTTFGYDVHVSGALRLCAWEDELDP